MTPKPIKLTKAQEDFLRLSASPHGAFATPPNVIAQRLSDFGFIAESREDFRVFRITPSGKQHLASLEK